MKHHLKDAEVHIERAIYGNIDRSEFNALLAVAHAAIAIAERLPPPAETWSEMYARLQNEARAQEEALAQEEDRDEL